MASARLRESFERAHHLLLVGAEHRAAMVQCGVDALLEGADTPSATRLAGSDDADPEELSLVFRAAAREVGVALPTEEEERAWKLRRTEGMERDGRAAPTRTSGTIFEDRLYLVKRRLAEGSPTPEMTAFLAHLDRPGEDYGAWLDELDARARRVTGSSARAALRVTDVLGSQAYGATTQAHLDALAALLAELGGP